MHIIWQNGVGTKGSPVASQTSWQSVLDLWTQFGESCIFVRSNLLLSGTEPRCSLYTRPTPPFLSDHLPAK